MAKRRFRFGVEWDANAVHRAKRVFRRMNLGSWTFVVLQRSEDLAEKLRFVEVDIDDL